MAKYHVVPSGRCDLDRQQSRGGHDETIDQHGDLLLRRGHMAPVICAISKPPSSASKRMGSDPSPTRARAWVTRLILRPNWASSIPVPRPTPGRHRNPGQGGEQGRRRSRVADPHFRQRRADYNRRRLAPLPTRCQVAIPSGLFPTHGFRLHAQIGGAGPESLMDQARIIDGGQDPGVHDL